MDPLPLLLSVPHGGRRVPPELMGIHRLSQAEIDADLDVGVTGIAQVIAPRVAASITTPIARAFVDLNRPPDDISADGVVKTHTTWMAPVYEKPLSRDLTEQLIDSYHRPYHERLTEYASDGRILCGIDLHTMAEYAPPISPGHGTRRPEVCLGNLHHEAAPRAWVEHLAEFSKKWIHPDVSINEPFSGGWITQSHHAELPWIQIEFSRSNWASPTEKGQKLLKALTLFSQYLQKRSDLI